MCFTDSTVISTVFHGCLSLQPQVTTVCFTKCIVISTVFHWFSLPTAPNNHGVLHRMHCAQYCISLVGSLSPQPQVVKQHFTDCSVISTAFPLFSLSPQPLLTKLRFTDCTDQYRISLVLSLPTATSDYTVISTVFHLFSLPTAPSNQAVGEKNCCMEKTVLQLFSLSFTVVHMLLCGQSYTASFLSSLYCCSHVAVWTKLYCIFSLFPLLLFTCCCVDKAILHLFSLPSTVVHMLLCGQSYTASFLSSLYCCSHVAVWTKLYCIFTLFLLLLFTCCCVDKAILHLFSLPSTVVHMLLRGQSYTASFLSSLYCCSHVAVWTKLYCIFSLFPLLLFTCCCVDKAILHLFSLPSTVVHMLLRGQSYTASFLSSLYCCSHVAVYCIFSLFPLPFFTCCCVDTAVLHLFSLTPQPQVTKLLFTNCPALAKQVKETFKPRAKYR